MRIYLAWQYITGYSTSGMHELVAQGHDVKLMYQEALVKPPFLAPFDDAELTKGLDAVGWTGQPDEDLLLQQVEEFQPDVLVVNSWHIKAYMRLAKKWTGKALRVVVMDHQWDGTLKQWGARLTRNLYIQRYFDAAWMPSDPQAEFARHLGFKQHQIITGLYTCEDAFFTGPQENPADAFLLVGRLLDTKGVDVLAAAYRKYREQSEAAGKAPWGLTVAGIGPMEDDLKAIPGVEVLGFVMPKDLPAVMARTGCMILPSRWEPWGVVVHEAVASGQAVILTQVCGAASKLVNDGYNGRVIAVGEVDEMVEAMHWIANADPQLRKEISRRSAELAKQFTPQFMASNLVSKAVELLPEALGQKTGQGN
ncbi:MAG: glycosyltransferase family 4 protein [Marmoricola sp.]